jgi:hypothetical protein
MWQILLRGKPEGDQSKVGASSCEAAIGSRRPGKGTWRLGNTIGTRSCSKVDPPGRLLADWDSGRVGATSEACEDGQKVAF